MRTPETFREEWAMATCQWWSHLPYHREWKPSVETPHGMSIYMDVENGIW